MTWDDALKIGLEVAGVAVALWGINRADRQARATERHQERDALEKKRQEERIADKRESDLKHAENKLELKEQTGLLHALDRRTTILETKVEPIADWVDRLRQQMRPHDRT